MGAHPYHYVVPWREDLSAALEALRQEVFAGGRYHGAQRRPTTPREALEWAGEAGTRSILDIERISARPALCCATPLSDREMLACFGTLEPTPEQVEDSDLFWDDIKRGTARIVVVRDSGVRKLLFAGYSFD